MRNSYWRIIYASVLLGATLLGAPGGPGILQLIEIDPGHSHISGLHAKSLPGASNEVHLYSPLTAELTAHLSALSRFNHRSVDPTHWSVRLFAGPDYMDAFKGESPGNVVALSGNNDKKIGYIATALEQGQNVFADKPWIINADDLPKLEAALHLAEKKQLVTFDWMTLRTDFAYRLQRELVTDRELFGVAATGSLEEPAVRFENLHALLKSANGIPQQRPASFLDVKQQGEGIADVGTHLADLAFWTLFPNQPISYLRDIQVLAAEHSPLILTLEQFTRLTGESKWPAYLKNDLVDNKLRYVANGSCDYALRGVHVRMKVGWQFEAAPGAQDSYFVSYRGTRSFIELRAGSQEQYIPELYVKPSQGADLTGLEGNLKNALARLKGDYPGVSFEKSAGSLHVLIPPADRSGDDLYKLFEQFTGYIHNRRTFPSFENENLLAKYYLTTKAVALARSQR